MVSCLKNILHLHITCPRSPYTGTTLCLLLTPSHVSLHRQAVSATHREKKDYESGKESAVVVEGEGR
jgi:hypothetical protein